MGGLFNATCSVPGEPPPSAVVPPDKQIADFNDQIHTIRAAQGLSLVLSAAELEGAGRQILHAEDLFATHTFPAYDEPIHQNNRMIVAP
jgi:hypothetical protein